MNSYMLCSHDIETAAVGVWADARGVDTSRSVKQASTVRTLFMDSPLPLKV